MNTKPSAVRPWVVTSFVVLTLVVAISVATFSQGHVQGEEFSASHFQKRTFEFYQIPLLKLQVSPIWRTNTTSPICVYLATSNLISVPTTPPNKWDLVRLSWRDRDNLYAADPALLLDWLEMTEPSGANSWEQWSKKNPQAAKTFWPIVQQLAQRELYLLLPDVFIAAQRERNSQDLKAALQNLLTEQQIAMAEDLRAADATVQAKELLVEAAAADPDNAKLQTALRSE